MQTQAIERPVEQALRAEEWIDHIETGRLNAETLEAIRELKEGGGVQFETTEELFKDLGIDDAI
ncbi:MAG: hypothetical protein FWG09_08165 [Synergistaceae bacterium]|nr:hypothetical protein [Synergistaceae bacterium]